MKIPDNTVIRPVQFPDAVYGASMVKWETWCVWYNNKLTEFSRDRIIAHELWHLIDDTCWVDHHLAERRAEELARQLLISKKELRGYLEDWFTTISELKLFFPSATDEMIEKSCRELLS